MTADLLREAAALMRRRAQMATESIDAVLDDILGDDATGLDGTWDEMVTSLRTLEGSPGDHITAWRPAVAVAVAKWLDTEAVHADDADYLAGHAMNVALTNVTPVYRPSTHEAFAVARAYLGRQS